MLEGFSDVGFPPEFIGHLLKWHHLKSIITDAACRFDCPIEEIPAVDLISFVLLVR